MGDYSKLGDYSELSMWVLNVSIHKSPYKGEAGGYSLEIVRSRDVKMQHRGVKMLCWPQIWKSQGCMDAALEVGKSKEKHFILASSEGG